MIKKSGENVDAPEEIHPEQIKRLLEEQPVDKKSRFRRYAQWGAVAAVFAPVSYTHLTLPTKRIV